MIDDFRQWFRRKLTVETPAPTVTLSDRDLAEALKLFRRHIHSLKRFSGESWRAIRPVRCPTPFAGCGYVEGRTSGLIVNSQITVVEADDEYDYTEVCVLVGGVPALVLLERNRHLRVTIIAGQDYLTEVFTPSGVYCDTLDDLKTFPVAIQTILRDLLTKVWEIEQNKPDAVEAMLAYAEKT